MLHFPWQGASIFLVCLRCFLGGRACSGLPLACNARTVSFAFDDEGSTAGEPAVSSPAVVAVSSAVVDEALGETLADDVCDASAEGDAAVEGKP